jgi:RNA polymerase sigma factor (sigma-70 family)
MPDKSCDRYSDLDATGRVQRLREVAYAYARREGLDEAEAEDCAQECVLRLLEELGPNLQPRRPVRDVDAWLRASVRHDVQDYTRRCAAERRHRADPTSADGEEELPCLWEAPDLGPSPEATLERRLLWESLAPAIKSLGEEEYVCFVSRHLLHVPVHEIAEAVGRTENHVSKVLAKAARHVREHLEGQGITAGEIAQALDNAAPHLPRPAAPTHSVKKMSGRFGKRPAEIANGNRLS